MLQTKKGWETLLWTLFTDPRLRTYALMRWCLLGSSNIQLPFSQSFDLKCHLTASFNRLPHFGSISKDNFHHPSNWLAMMSLHKLDNVIIVRSILQHWEDAIIFEERLHCKNFEKIENFSKRQSSRIKRAFGGLTGPSENLRLSQLNPTLLCKNVTPLSYSAGRTQFFL